MRRHGVSRFAEPMARLVLSFFAVVTLAVGGEQGENVPPARADPFVIHQNEEFAPADEFVMVGSIKTHFIQMGETGRPLVFVHGFGSNTESWRKNVNELGKQFRTYALDLKGFGLTAKPKDGEYHFETYARHLLAFLDVMKLEKPILIGNSMGGAVAARLALRYPDRIGGLILIDAAPVAFPRPALPWSGTAPSLTVPSGSGKSLAKLMPRLVLAMITRKTVESGLKLAFHNPALVTAERVEMIYRPYTTEGAAEALVAMMSPAPEPATPLPPLQSLRLPTLVVWGRHDQILPISLADMYVRAIPGARKVVFENSGHLPHEEEPDAFNSLVAGFVNQIK